MIDIFESTPNWCFTQKDQKAKKKLSDLRIEACNNLPPDHKTNRIVCLFNEIRSTKLYECLKTLPKGTVHHIHFDCCEDQDFYAQHIVTDPIVYLGKKLDCFHIGTKKQAEQNGWISMQTAKQNFSNQKEFIKHVSNICMLNNQQISSFSSLPSKKCWQKFQSKINNFFPLLFSLHIFKKYTRHILIKYIKNGYQRLEFRAFLATLTQYDQDGNVIKNHNQNKFMEAFDEVFNQIIKQHPNFTAGFIFFGLKFLKPEQNANILKTVLQKNWPKTIGIDFVQQQNMHGCLKPYDEIATQVLAMYPGQDIKKVYHAGETQDHLNKNVQTAIESGSVRIGHGINVIQHPELIEICKNKKICFEKNPVSNIILGYVNNPRLNSAHILLSLGVPVTINPDDPARFGLQDTTMDYFVSFISSNWSLKHLKLIGIHSINHAICSQQTKKQMIIDFNKLWDEWVDKFISM